MQLLHAFVILRFRQYPEVNRLLSADRRGGLHVEERTVMQVPDRPSVERQYSKERILYKPLNAHECRPLLMC
jgi:hypothetical protein